MARVTTKSNAKRARRNRRSQTIPASGSSKGKNTNKRKSNFWGNASGHAKRGASNISKGAKRGASNASRRYKNRGANRAGRKARNISDDTFDAYRNKQIGNYQYDHGDYGGAAESRAKSNWYNTRAQKRSGDYKRNYDAVGNIGRGVSNVGRGAARTVGRTGRGINNASGGTIGMITGGWAMASYKMRAVITMVLTVAILFVPFGIFQYGGWSMYLAFTWVINGFYWFVATIVNGILNMFIGSVDTIFSYLTSLVTAAEYQPLESWTLTTGSLLDPDSFKPTSFDNRYLAEWFWDGFGSSVMDIINGILDTLKRMVGFLIK